MTELIVEEINETVIEIEGGPTLSTTVDDTVETIVQEFVDPVLIDLNSGPRGEPGAAILTGFHPPDTNVGVMGDMYIVTQGTVLVGQVFRKTSPATWTDVGNVRGPAGGVNTVNGYTGPDVVLDKDDIGLDRVDNTNDAEKPISTAVQSALDNIGTTAVTLAGAQTITGAKTFTGVVRMPGPRISPTGDHGYISFHSRDANPDLRTAYVGVGSAGSKQFTIHNEMVDGGLALITTGTAAVNAVTSELQENGVRVATVNTAMLLTGNQLVGGLKTFQSGITAPSLNLVQPGNASIEIGRIDGSASTPHIDFHTSATAQDYNVRLLASGGTAGNGQGTLDITASQVTLTGTLTVQGGMAASNLTGTIDNARLSNTVERTDVAQTITVVKTYTASPIVPTPTTDMQVSTKKYVDDRITQLTTGAPALLDTLDELAAALGDDPNFATTITNNIATKVSLTGNQTISDTKTFTGENDAGTDGYAAPIVITNANPRIGFHSPGVIAGQMVLRASGDFAFRNPPDSAYSGIRAGAVYDNDNRVYSASYTGIISGNGAGLTTLNADNLSSGTISDARMPSRLREKSYFGRISDFNNAQSNGWYLVDPPATNGPSAAYWNLFVESVDGTWITQTAHQIAGEYGIAWRRHYQNTSVWTAWYKVRLSEAEVDARYMTLGTAQSITGAKTFYVNVASADWSARSMLLHNNSGTGSTILAFQRGPSGVVGMISFDVNSDFNFKNAGNDTWYNLRAGAIYDTGNRVYSASNPPPALPTTVVHRVVYSGTAYPARPSGATYVEWVGPVAPAAATSNDTWVNTAL